MAFLSTALRKIAVDLPFYDSTFGHISLGTGSLSAYLSQELNWKKIGKNNMLQAGDVVFTIDKPYIQNSPTHTFVFFEWVDFDTGEARVVDNQGFLHLRNVYGSVLKDHDPFAYALRDIPVADLRKFSRSDFFPERFSSGIF